MSWRAACSEAGLCSDCISFDVEWYYEVKYFEIILPLQNYGREKFR